MSNSIWLFWPSSSHPLWSNLRFRPGHLLWQSKSPFLNTPLIIIDDRNSFFVHLQIDLQQLPLLLLAPFVDRSECKYIGLVNKHTHTHTCHTFSHLSSPLQSSILAIVVIAVISGYISEIMQKVRE